MSKVQHLMKALLSYLPVTCGILGKRRKTE